LREKDVSAEIVNKSIQLDEIAKERGQTLAQMAIGWVLREGKATSALIGASKTSQIEDAAAALNGPAFTEEELRRIDQILDVRKL
jgi:L-glyceraldehyde 3-phosphate reductase